MSSSRLLVISSCTGHKVVNTPAELKLEDFANTDRLKQRERDLASYRRPASVMYTGKQHEYLMCGVDKLRRAYGGNFVDLRILSAGYGLIEEDRVICPYDVTFSKMGKPQRRAWGRRLGVPSDVRTALEDFDVVIFLLGSDYHARGIGRVEDHVVEPSVRPSGNGRRFASRRRQSPRIDLPSARRQGVVGARWLR